ncbi:hypothetical protein D7322_15885 [Sphingobacterium puteale]|uniref:Uncharacterized protein n=2 Tax=Sphingobacterium puteale TaxID=2420510 RepID=A0A420VX34_9SPHI|nr:hypothetical protein D7322_15885 [Sphingobacterium puteale]
MKFMSIILGLPIFFGCQNNKEKVSIDPHPEEIELNKKETDSLWQKALNGGDFDAYEKISENYLDTYRFYDLYYYSLIMANKYQCPKAYEHLYYILHESITINGVKMKSNDEITNNMAKFYLMKSVELGNKDAESFSREIFGDSIPPLESGYFLRKIEDEYRKLERMP